MSITSAQLGGVRRIEGALVLCAALVCGALQGCRKAPDPPPVPLPTPASADLAALVRLHPLWGDLERARQVLTERGVAVSDPVLAAPWRADEGAPVTDPPPTTLRAGSLGREAMSSLEGAESELDAIVSRNARPSPRPLGQGPAPEAAPTAPARPPSPTAARRREAEEELLRRERLEAETRWRRGDAETDDERAAARSRGEAEEQSARVRQQWLREHAGDAALPEASSEAKVESSPRGRRGDVEPDYEGLRALRRRELTAELERERARLGAFFPRGTPFALGADLPDSPESAWARGPASESPLAEGREQETQSLLSRYESLGRWVVEDTASVARTLGRSAGLDVRFDGGAGRDCTAELSAKLQAFWGDVRP